MRFSLYLLCALILFACSTTQGNHVIRKETAATIAAKIIDGRTTQADIWRMFGAPMSTSFTDGGNEIYKYELIDSKPKISNHIPIISIFKAGEDHVKKTLTILFDDKHIVKKHSFDSSEYDTNTGIIK